MHRWYRLFALVISLLFSLTPLLSACAPAPTPIPTVAVKEVSSPPLPPVVVTTQPARGAEHPPDAPIVIRFDQPMDERSTLKAFHIEPEVAGTLKLEGNALVFQPKKPLERGRAYRITLTETARSADGVPLNTPLQLRFAATGYLEVVATQPADGTTDVPVDQLITVVFNRPVVPLATIDRQAEAPQPLVLDPPVEGEGRWLNTSVYTFKPRDGLQASTTYRATIQAGLTDVTGGTLAEDHTWTFRTTEPMVLTVTPLERPVPPTTAITVTFSQPMDKASTEAAFALLPAQGELAVVGSYFWPDDHTLVFQPDGPLKFGARYRVVVEQTARSALGDGTLRERYSRSFAVVPLPKITGTRPQDGSVGINPTRGVRILLNTEIDPDTIPDNVTIIPEPTRVYSYYNRWDKAIYLSWSMIPSTTYTVTIGAGLADPYGNTIGEDYTFSFTTGNYRPYAFILSTGQIGTLNAYTDTVVGVSYRNVSRLDFQLYKLTEGKVRQLMGRNGWKYWQNFRGSEASLVHAWSVPAAPTLNKPVSQKIMLTDADGNRLSPGLYMLELRAPEVRYGKSRRPSRLILVVSRFNIVLKSTATEALVWVTDLQSGQPVPGLQVTVDEELTTLGSNATDDDGVAVIQFKQTRTRLWDPLFVSVGEGERYGWAISQWSYGISPWDFNLPGGYSGYGPYNVYIYTDRPIYRPGQTVYWKAIVRLDDDAHYSLPELGTKVTVTIMDGQGKKVYHEQHELNELGTVAGELALGEEAALGYYAIRLRIQGEDRFYSGSFQVAEYRKPEYQLKVTTDRKEYVQGDEINVEAAASYFFGGPVKNGKVRWTLLAQDSYFNFDRSKCPGGQANCPRYRFADFNPEWGYFRYYQESGRYGEEIARGTGTTDAEGRFTLTVPADISEHSGPQQFTFDIAVTDINGQEVAGRTSVMVHKGELYVGIAPRRYVGTAGKLQTADLIVVTTESDPVPDREFTVVVNRLRWYSVQEEDDSGRLRWVSKVKETPVVTETLRSGADGTAILIWTPSEGGSYLIRASAEDDRGNEVRSAAFAWISGREYVSWRRENNDRIQLIADRDEYAPGDVAHIMIPHPYQGTVKALLTVERGHVMHHKLLTLTSNSQQVEMPIELDYTPNIYVSVVVVKGQDETSPMPSLKVGYIQLPISTVERQLQVTITPSAEKVGPRDAVSYDIETLNYAGQPVVAELSLALVDKAVLTLAARRGGTLLDRFYAQRGLGVSTAASLVASLNRLVAEEKALGAKGGGGGGEAGVPTVRREFPDIAFWEAFVRTDKSGHARVTVHLPDNLTTWTMTGLAVTQDTKVGEATTDIIATKALLVRPVAPRFLTVGDQVDLAAIVQNNSDQDLTVDISLTATGVALSSDTRQQVQVPAGDRVKVVWPADVDAMVDQVVLRWTALSNVAGLSDAVEITLPVYHYSTPEVVGTAGEVALDEPRVEAILLPEGIDSTRGELRVKLEPSLAAGMQDGLKYLKHYPYECTEQTMSRFLPNVLTYRALRDLGIERPDLEENLPRQVSIGLQRLYARQNPDGGWGWFQDKSRPFLTAYVLFGLTQARDAGFAVDGKVINRAIGYLVNHLRPPKAIETRWELNRQAFMLYALALAGNQQVGRTSALYEVRERLGLYGKALLALTLGELDREGQQGRIDALLADLTSAAILSATGAHWEEGQVDYWTMGTDTRTTAMVLDAFARLKPTDMVAPNAVRWLMVTRKDGRWESTQETAWALIALTDWMVATGELNADYSFRVSVNSQELGVGSVDRSNVDQPVELHKAVRDLLLDQANALVLERFAEEGQSGSGRLYYTAHLKYYLPADKVEPRSRGIVVSRQYVLADNPDVPISQAKVGDVIQVKLTIIAPHSLHYLVVEDPLPAGAEAIDVSLRTTSAQYQAPQIKREGEEEPYYWWWRWWIPTHTELRDEKVVLFATWLRAGTYEYTYLMRANVPGRFLTLPTTAYEMYFPEVWGRSSGGAFTIAP
ncbi:MAG TPA: hypothetical protein EYH31_06770 [Anaerolineae bacterium]|nr:hypothetical protein [Anaerolineae bacterium]